jgi:basic membrane protein A
MRNKILSTAAAAAMLSLGTIGAEAATKACYIYVGPIGDFGWSYQHHQGLLEME